MAELPAWVKSLADAGGWTIVLLLIGLIGLGATKRFRWWVPGWIYEDERKQRGISETQAERTTKALEKQATANAVMARENERIRSELAELRAALAKSSHD
jgi:hypothetical protein